MGTSIPRAQALAVLPIYESLMLPEFRQVRCKAREPKRWMRGTTYHKRVDKKWRKRYGFRPERVFITHGQAIYAHPSSVAWLKQFLLKADSG